MLKRLLKLKFILIFFLLAQIVMMIVVTIHEIHDRELFLENKTKLAQSEYDTIYWKIKEQSAMIFQESINKKEIIDIFKQAYTADESNQTIIREQLYTKLLPSYTHLRELIHLKQLHFHLPDNHSFLRMHKPKKYEDDLSYIRDTVAYVNKYKTPIDSFEEGRVNNGFRFVYPLSDEKNRHIGSVEISFSSNSFQNTLSNDIRIFQFIFSKKIIQEKVWEQELSLNYSPSPISPDFFIENEYKENNRFTEIQKNIQKNLNPQLREIFEKNLSSKKGYSVSLTMDEQIFIISFLPIKNTITKDIAAYLLVITPSPYLQHLYFENKLLKIVALALLVSLFLLIYRHYKHEDTLKHQQNLLAQQSKMAQMGSMLSNISHQWKQPLARINAILLQIPFSLSLKKDEQKSLDKHLEDIENLTFHMGNTLENFRNYFHPKKKKGYFYLRETIDRALVLIDFSTINQDINLFIDASDDIRVYNYEDEIIQVFITLVINAIEAFKDKEISDKFIKIVVKNDIKTIHINIIDNAGGVEDEIISFIFNPYFSTKENTQNDGIGLYMAKTIVECRMQGKLNYFRQENLSNFQISIKGLRNV